MPRHEGTRGSSTALDRTFAIALVLKGLDGVLEVAGGIVLLLVAPHSLQHFLRWIVSHDLAGDPHDFIARHLLHSASELSRHTTRFGAVYLLSHGVAKVVLIVALLRHQLWAYPWLIALLVVFVAYQCYRLTYAPSIGLALLTAFDVFVAVLTWMEWRRRLRPREPAPVG